MQATFGEVGRVGGFLEASWEPLHLLYIYIQYTSVIVFVCFIGGF